MFRIKAFRRDLIERIKVLLSSNECIYFLQLIDFVDKFLKTEGFNYFEGLWVNLVSRTVSTI